MIRQHTWMQALVVALIGGWLSVANVTAQTDSQSDIAAMAQMQQLQSMSQQLQQRYAGIMAKLQRIIEVAQENNDSQMLQRAQALQSKAKKKFESVMQQIHDKMTQLAQTDSDTATGTKLPGNRRTVDDDARQTQWQGAGRPVGDMVEGSNQPKQGMVDTGQVNTQKQGQMQGVSREAYEDQVYDDRTLKEAVEESGSQP